MWNKESNIHKNSVASLPLKVGAPDIPQSRSPQGTLIHLSRNCGSTTIIGVPNACTKAGIPVVWSFWLVLPPSCPSGAINGLPCSLWTGRCHGSEGSLLEAISMFQHSKEPKQSTFSSNHQYSPSLLTRSLSSTIPPNWTLSHNAQSPRLKLGVPTSNPPPSQGHQYVMGKVQEKSHWRCGYDQGERTVKKLVSIIVK